MLISLYSFPLSAKSIHHGQLLESSPIRSPITNLRFINNGILFSNTKDLYFKQKPVKLLSTPQDSEGAFDVNHILKDEDDFYLSTDIGLFKNYRKVFYRTVANYSTLGKDKIYLASPNGIYFAKNKSKDFIFKYDWQLMAQSPIETNFLALNKSKSNPLYASSEQGFYFYNSRKKEWLDRSHGLETDFNDQYGFGRFHIIHHGKNKNTIILPSNAGIFISTDTGLSWQKNNQGLKSNDDGFYSLREIIELNGELFLISSNGLYQSSTDEINWQAVNLEGAQLGENFTVSLHSIAIKETAIDNSRELKQSIIVGDSQGNIYEIVEGNQTRELYAQKTEITDEPFYIVKDPNKSKQELKQEIKSSKEAKPSKKQSYESLESISYNQEIKEILDNEPNIKDVHKHALKFAGIPTGKTFGRYKMQARLRNVLPNFELFANRNNLNTISLETNGSEDVETSSSSSVVNKFKRVRLARDNNDKDRGLKVSWKLGNLIYDPEVNDINTNARITANIRENILTEITQIYFARKELLLELLELKFKFDGIFSKRLLAKSLEVEQYTAQIDARTGGWFSEQIPSTYI